LKGFRLKAERPRAKILNQKTFSLKMRIIVTFPQKNCSKTHLTQEKLRLKIFFFFLGIFLKLKMILNRRLTGRLQEIEKIKINMAECCFCFATAP